MNQSLLSHEVRWDYKLFRQFESLKTKSTNIELNQYEIPNYQQKIQNYG